jgi:hypothetical protein
MAAMCYGQGLLVRQAVIPTNAGIQEDARRAPVHTIVVLCVRAHGMHPRVKVIFKGVLHAGVPAPHTMIICA